MKKILYIIFAFTVIQASDGGYAGSGFRYGSNAREISMAKAMNTVYNKGYNAFGNPALLSEVKNIEYGFSYFSMSLDRSIQSFSISRPMPPTASVSFSFLRAGVDDIMQTDWSGNEYGNISSWEGYGMLSFGNRFGNLSFGLNLKAYKNQLTPEYASDGTGVDLGMIYKINNQSKIGLYINNLSSTYNWKVTYNNSSNQYEQTMPRIVTAGYSYNHLKFLISSQLDFFVKDFDLADELLGQESTTNKYIRLRLGSELNMFEINKMDFYLRFGLIVDEDNNAFSIGCGVPFNISESMDMEFNYALDPGFRGEGISHLITFSILNY